MGLKLGKRTYYAAEVLDNAAPVSVSASVAAAIMTTAYSNSNCGGDVPPNHNSIIHHISRNASTNNTTSTSDPPFSGSASVTTNLVAASPPKRIKANNSSSSCKRSDGRSNNSNNNNSGLSSVNPAAAVSIIRCQSEGCDADLSTSNTSVKEYHRRHRVCAYHAKASFVRVASVDQRFCQQCIR